MYLTTRIINGFEVPAPEENAHEKGSVYYIPVLTNKLLYERIKWDVNSTVDSRLLERGLIFLKKEDAITNAKAMMGIDPLRGDEE